MADISSLISPSRVSGKDCESFFWPHQTKKLQQIIGIYCVFSQVPDPTWQLSGVADEDGDVGVDLERDGGAMASAAALMPKVRTPVTGMFPGVFRIHGLPIPGRACKRKEKPV